MPVCPSVYKPPNTAMQIDKKPECANCNHWEEVLIGDYCPTAERFIPQVLTAQYLYAVICVGTTMEKQSKESSTRKEKKVRQKGNSIYY